jgi:hypothetical protein
MANTMARTRRVEPKVKEKAKLLKVINVVVQTTLLRNA